MTNLVELIERYSKERTNGLGISSLGYYEINSDKKLSLNSYSGFGNFILNDNGEVELYEFFDAPYQYFKDGVEIPPEEYLEALETVDFGSDEFDEQYTTEHNNCRHWWGKTLDKYYPHPWFPEKEIVGFTVVNRIPMFDLYEYCILDADDYICSTEDSELCYHISHCLHYPEFFKPNYKL